MLKTKQRDLKKIISDQNETQAMKCAECFGFFVDGYQKCTSTTCPLLKTFPTIKYISTNSFVSKMKQLARDLGNDNFFVSSIGARQKPLSINSKKPGSTDYVLG